MVAMNTPKVSSHSDLPSSLGELGCELSREDLRHTAYEIFVGACRVTGGRPLTYISQSERAVERSTSSLSSSSSSESPSLHRSLTSSAAHQVKRALGLKSKKNMGKDESSSNLSKKKMNAQELVKIQMGISEQEDTRIRRGLLRISAGQLGRRVESMILPLELLQHLKPSDFMDHKEYESWQSRYLKIMEAGLIIHPHLPLEKSDFSPQKIRQIIHQSLDAESIQTLRSLAISLASRSFDGSRSEKLHWADGPPLNLHLYKILLESCFDHDDGTIVDEVDEVIEQIKKTWSVLGMNQSLHNLIFILTLFQQFSLTEKSNPDFVTAADKMLCEVSEDAKKFKDPVYSRVLTSTLTLTMNWAEQRLLAYHDTFHSGSVHLMRSIISLGVSSAEILAEIFSQEHPHKRREKVDVARDRVDAYIRSSLRTAFAEIMEETDARRRSMMNSPLPVLSILAKNVGVLAKKENEIFSPVLLTWHPLAAAIAMSTLHMCYSRELKQFIADVTELTPDTVHVLKTADELERELVQIAVESSAESEDGGKSIIREMPPFEAESTLTRLARTWIVKRVDSFSQRVNHIVQKQGNLEDFAPTVDILRMVDDTMDDFFRLPITTHNMLLPDLFIGLDRSIQLCISSTKAAQGKPSDFFPELPPLTRCAGKSTLWRKKEKPQSLHTTQPQADTTALTKISAAMNTLHHVRSELDRLEKKGGGAAKFDLSSSASREALQHLCEIAAARIIFIDLRHVIYDSLYARNGSTMIRIGPLIRELDLVLERISNSLHSRVRNRAITALMKTCFEGFLLVLLAGGPGRRFSAVDFKSLEEDFTAIRDLFLADGDGLPEEVVEKAGRKVRDVVALFGEETETLILRFRERMEAESGGDRKRMKTPVTTGRWSSEEANTLLRVLCHRDDEVASKFLKKTFGLPKKL